MRSRDGDSNIWRAICSLIFFTYSLNASEFIISYRIVVADATVLNEKLSISQAMQPCAGTKSSYVDLESDNSNNLKNIISNNHDQFIEFLQKNSLNISHTSTTINLKNRSKTILNITPKCFTVDFNDDFVRITHLKKE